MSFNKITIVGNLGRDPELRYTQSGKPTCQFSIATNEKRKNKEGDREDNTTWFRVTLWGRQAELAAQYLTKGKQVYIEGRLRTEVWTDKDNKERTSLEVNGTDMQFVGNQGGGQSEEREYGNTTGQPRNQPRQKPDTTDDEDIPF